MMPFLRGLLRFFVNYIPPKRLPDKVASKESLTRFVFQSNQVSTSRAQLKSAALMPEPGPLGLETSVCRIDGLTESQIWSIAAKKVAPTRNRPVHARGDFVTQSALDQALTVAADKHDYYQHALLIGWPSEKEKQKAIALELAKRTSARWP